MRAGDLRCRVDVVELYCGEGADASISISVSVRGGRGEGVSVWRSVLQDLGEGFQGEHVQIQEVCRLLVDCLL